MSKFLFILFIAFATLPISAAIKLPVIFSDNMVIQRNAPVKIWGWSTKNSAIQISFNGQTIKSKSDRKGFWIATLKPMNHGGPLEMKISNGKEDIVLTNILIGDVWLGSGQSNMEWVVRNSNDAEQEISAANYDKIRLFTVAKKMSFTPLEDITGGPWEICSSATVGKFSAVAYFFGRKLHQELDIPIGLVNSSWGGTNIETWISWDVMSLDEDFKNLDMKEHQQMAMESESRAEKYQQALKNDPGISEKWYDVAYNSASWKKMELPQEWGKTDLSKSDGIVWFRKEVSLPSGAGDGKSILGLGPIDDRDDTYINGKLIGSTPDYSHDRQYPLEAGILKEGSNIIVVKVTDTGGGGGMNGRKEQMFIEVNGERIPLQGGWEYKASVLNTDFGIVQTGPNSFPSQLYNAMIAPITSFSIKGAIWYQGESNAGNAKKYRALFPALIKDWRSRWGNDFPFLWVQLANFMATADQPKESSWAELREAQTSTLSVPLTGQALAIDIGVANDIHPRNKQDVGLRLALNALKIAYGKDVVATGPMFKSVEKEGNKMILSFTGIGSGIQAKGDRYGYLRGFAIAGADKKFVWAKAEINGDQVIVHSPDVAEPVAVRYAWGDNPDDANFYNKEELPACPFRTDF
jgi:sialate O-acetylesterase